MCLLHFQYHQQSALPNHRRCMNIDETVLFPAVAFVALFVCAVADRNQEEDGIDHQEEVRGMIKMMKEMMLTTKKTIIMTTRMMMIILIMTMTVMMIMTIMMIKMRTMTMNR